MSAEFRIGVDVGGTFTDLVVLDEAKGDSWTLKVASTPHDPSEAVLAAVSRARSELGFSLKDVLRFAHGTTVATNTILEGVGAETGLLATDGFRDVLEIQRHKRYELFNLEYQKLPPLVPRRAAVGIPERIAADGSVVEPLDEEALRSSVQELAAQGIKSFAISFLFSFVNPAHEQRAAEIVREEVPDAYISISSGVYPQFREYERTSTTVVNSYIGPRVSAYIDRMQRELQAAGLASPLFIMQSNGGTISADETKGVPCRIVESGPAAGVMAASHFGSQIGRKRILAFDMGGTTAKAGLIDDGRPRLVPGQEVGGGINLSRINQGGGYFIGAATVDLAEVSAGGGSVAWIDPGGLLKVGPRSAGAVPGPICYGKGGEQPTITDANVLLGRIPADYFLGGEIQLDVEAARAAVEARIAGPLGLSIEAACAGIIDVANANMLKMLRIISVEKGYDPRDYSMMCFGGAGPVQAILLAGELGVGEVVVPPSPGLVSAQGLLVADIRYDFRQTYAKPFEQANFEELEGVYKSLERTARQALADNNVPTERITLERWAELRYDGQAYELPVAVPAGKLQNGVQQLLADSFHDAHEKQYGRTDRERPLRIVHISLSATGTAPTAPQRHLDPGDGTGASARKAERAVFFSEHGWIDCRCYERAQLGAGDRFPGPAIVEAADSTTVVPHGWTVTCDEHGNLIVTRGA